MIRRLKAKLLASLSGEIECSPYRSDVSPICCIVGPKGSVVAEFGFPFWTFKT